jgi:hypothetical protein
MWSESTTQASMRNGARARARRTASRNASICVANKPDRRSSRQEPDCGDNPPSVEYVRLQKKAECAVRLGKNPDRDGKLTNSPIVVPATAGTVRGQAQSVREVQVLSRYAYSGL